MAERTRLALALLALGCAAPLEPAPQLEATECWTHCYRSWDGQRLIEIDVCACEEASDE